MYRIRPWLYIGKFRDTRDRMLLHNHQIGAMLLLAERVEHKGISSLFLPMEDGEAIPFELIQQGVEFIRQQKAQGDTVLVACGAGRSRSTAFALAALYEEEGLDLMDAFHEVCKNHPDAMPNPAIWDSLFLYYDTGETFDSMMGTIFAIRDQKGSLRP